MKDLRRLRVAQVITPYQLVLNAGSDDGVQYGDQFVIYTLGKTIVDPETGEELEPIQIIRGRGRVIHIQRTICTIDSDWEGGPVWVRHWFPLYIPGFTQERTPVDRRQFDHAQTGDVATIMNRVPDEQVENTNA